MVQMYFVHLQLTSAKHIAVLGWHHLTGILTYNYGAVVYPTSKIGNRDTMKNVIIDLRKFVGYDKFVTRSVIDVQRTESRFLQTYCGPEVRQQQTL